MRIMPLPVDHTVDMYLGRTQHVTLLGLGRGISDDGVLGKNEKFRVSLTLQAACALRERGCKVLIIWTGGKCLDQVKRDVTIGGAGSEGGAMFAYARLLIETKDSFKKLLDDEDFEHMPEIESTSTVGNMARCAEILRRRGLSETLIIAVTDTLHFLYDRVLFAAEIAFPEYHIDLIEMTFSYTWKQKLKQLLSAYVTRFGMTGIKRGDSAAILRRQALLERLTGR
jgi:hypothetical protein